MTKTKPLMYENGIQFECQGSGKCCTSHGEFGFVFLTKEDRVRLAEFLSLDESEFKKQYCDETSGIWHLKERPKNPDCLFLKDKKCSIYQARPNQCRTWPFWPEVMKDKSWKKEVASFCPGVGKGKLWSKEEIEEIIKLDKINENNLLNET